MTKRVKHIVIIGGGTAGWLTAGIIASEHKVGQESGISITLIESPDIRPLGVGEGTWPSMRNTLQRIGVSETDFIRYCDVSFKQGSKFCNWTTNTGEAYYHPFSLPEDYGETNLVNSWQPIRDQVSFADAVCSQSRLCDLGKAPKQISTPEYAFNVNYGYHLDAGKFSEFLKDYCVTTLGVTHILDNITQVNSDESDDIDSVSLQKNPDCTGDLFVDCTGFSSLLIGKHFQIPFVCQKGVLFNDTALAAQVPYATENAPIESQTLSTAQTAGWIWDIGLASRRGVGHVYSSAHIAQEDAEMELRKYMKNSCEESNFESIALRKISFNPGYREKLWHRNCVAIGVSAGFIEPLEASALVLIELSATLLSEQLPANRTVMDVIAKRFNEKFSYRWEKIIDFLKLHYVLTKRTDSPYWRDHCDSATIPESLQDLVELWQHQPPWRYDTVQIDEMFPSASFQYVLYGMGFETFNGQEQRRNGSVERAKSSQFFRENAKKTQQLIEGLPLNRELLEKINKHGLKNI